MNCQQPNHPDDSRDQWFASHRTLANSIVALREFGLPSKPYPKQYIALVNALVNSLRDVAHAERMLDADRSASEPKYSAGDYDHEYPEEVGMMFRIMRRITFGKGRQQSEAANELLELLQHPGGNDKFARDFAENN